MAPIAKRAAVPVPKVEESDGEVNIDLAMKPKKSVARKPTTAKSDSDLGLLVESTQRDKGKNKGKSATKRKRSVQNRHIAIFDLTLLCSDSLNSATDEDNQPVTKKIRAANRQPTVKEFLDKPGPSKMNSNPKNTSKKRLIESDLEEDFSKSIPVPAREGPPKRTVRGKAKKYIEVESDPGDETVEQDATFVISD